LNGLVLFFSENDEFYLSIPIGFGIVFGSLVILEFKQYRKSKKEYERVKIWYEWYQYKERLLNVF
jgi:hypothetical protein